MAQGELGLADYWRILVKRKWEIAGAVALVLSATGLMLRQQVPVYKAVAKVKLERAQALSAGVFDGFQSYYENPIATESRVIESRAIAEEVARQLAPGLAEDSTEFHAIVAESQGSIKAEPILETNIVQVIATAQTAEHAARLANLTAEAYIATNLMEKNKQARKVREFVQGQLEQTEQRLIGTENALKSMREQGRATGMAVTLENRIMDLEGELARLQPKLTEAHPDIIRLKEQLAQRRQQLRGLPDAELDYARLSRELEVNEKTYRTLRERLEEARIAEAEKIADATIIERALVPGSPMNPPKRFGWAIGLLLGLLLGCVLAFVFETLDTSIGTIEDVEKLVQVPVLAVIPHVGRLEEVHPDRPRWKFWLKSPADKAGLSAESRLGLHAHYQPHSIASEAYRILRTNLKLGPERKLLLVTSSGPAEGKTKLVSNLALVTAQSGSRTLIISADLRRPEMDHVFGLEREAGVADVLQGTIPFDRAVRGLSDFILGKFGFDETVKHPYLANLFVMTAGHRLPNSPAELLGSKAMNELLATARQQFDVVLLDMPPILPVADSLVLASQVDGVLLVYQVGRISRGALLRAKMQLDSVGARLIGIVLNHVRPEVKTEPQYYYYEYRRRYAEKGAAPPAPS
jgi:tyrosine-protein kinase Etk/Wzc